MEQKVSGADGDAYVDERKEALSNVH